MRHRGERSSVLLLLLVIGASCSRPPERDPDALVLMLPRDAEQLDPRFVGDPYGLRVTRLLFASLVTIDPRTLEVVPDLAERVTLIGPEETVGIRVAAVLLIVVGISHVWYVFFTRRGRGEMKAMLPHPRDAADMAENLKYHTWRSKKAPKFGRYDYSQKAEYWAVIWGTAVMGLTDLAIGNLESCEITLDGNQGTVCTNPSLVEIDAFRQRMQEEQAIAAQLETLRRLPAQTMDGMQIPMYVNLGIGVNDLPMRDTEYEGVGLYRTEFFFIARDTLPTEDEQYRLYRDLLESFTPKPVTIRTLDTGGDKKLPFFTITETNPVLGRRGIRFSLDHTEIFLTQLRALLRANAGVGNLQILFPMISRIHEIDAALGLLDRAYSDLTAEGHAAAKPHIGAMIEVPAAPLSATLFARKLDFLSIGTNDLIQYTLAIDRVDDSVTYLYDPLHPAVLRLIRMVIEAGQHYQVPVSMCGEMAGDPRYTRLLLGMRLEEFSVHPTTLLEVKDVIQRSRICRLTPVADDLLASDDPAEISALLGALNAL